MFNSLRKGLIFFLLLSSFSLYAEHESCDHNCSEGIQYIQCRKTYVALDQLAFLDNDIYVNMGDFIVKTTGIHSDSQGYFFDNIRDTKCGALQEPCYKCSACNFIWDSHCYVCGRKL